VSSLKERLDLLEADLKSNPVRISVHTELPFAIFRYDPDREWELRDQVKLLGARLAASGKTVQHISLADLLWEAIDASEGLDAIVELERDYGFEAAQQQVTVYLSDPTWHPLADALVARLELLDPSHHVAFLVRASAMTPGIYHMSRLFEEMQGKTGIPTVLFYPGTLEGITGLQFMGLKEREALGNYRVKIYG